MGKSRFWVRSVPTLSPEEQTSDWVIKPLIKDYPGTMGKISTYYSLLRSGSIPHEIHSHDEEEIIVLLSGHLDLISPSNRVRIGPGSFFHYPPDDLHTIQSVGSESAAFLVFKWMPQKAKQTQLKADFFYFDANKLAPWDEQKSIQHQQVCDGQPLANGGRLVMSALRFAPHTGYPAHKHSYDLIVVLLSGEMHDIAYTKSAPVIIYYPAGTIHALAPNSPDPINMLEFVFYQPDSSDLLKNAGLRFMK